MIATSRASYDRAEARCLRRDAWPRELKISIGQHSDKGRKATNQDFHGALIPEGAAARA